MKKKIKLSDLELMLHLFAPKQYSLYIFDPFARLVEDKPFDVSRMNVTKPKVLVNLANKIICYKGMPLDNFDIILDFGNSKMPSNFVIKRFNFINNSTGGMRWLYQKGKLNTALSFYNTSSLRAKIIAAGMKLTEAIGLGNLISKGNITVSSRNILKIDNLLKTVDHESYAIFTGTPGYDRTAVISIQNAGKNTHYAKVALNNHGINLLDNERTTLSSLGTKSFESIITPKIEPMLDKALLVMTNEGPDNAKNIGNLSSQHVDALAELFDSSMVAIKINGSQFWDNVIDNISFLDSESKMGELKESKELLIKLKDEIAIDDKIVASIAHSDFTPWNTKKTDKGLYIYDWELTKRNIPALFDLFHFHFQNGIMVQKSGLEEIMNNIEESCADPKINEIIKKHNIDVSLYMKLYLLRTISYYLATFQEQAFLSDEQKDQIAIWNQAIKTNLSTEHVLSHRKVFIPDFYNSLVNYKHAMLKFDCMSLDALSVSSDLDIAILKEDRKNIIKICEEHQLVSRTNAMTKSYMSTLQIFFKDGSFLSIDLINKFKRKGIEMMKILPLLSSSKMNRYGVMVPAKSFDLEYAMLFYNLNHAAVPIRYHAHFSGASNDTMIKGMNHMNAKYELKIKNFQEIFTKNDNIRDQIKSIVRKQKFVSLTNRFSNFLNYIIDTIKASIFNKGFIVTLSGVDGVGKSTIVQAVKEQMEDRFRKEVVLLRHRPGILPILSSIRHGSIKAAEQAAGEKLPRMGTNKNFFSSLLRFGYYYADYILGQVYIYFKYLLRGKVVLYDRYYFDFISDPKRSNIHLSKRFIKTLYLFVLKPRLNILLWADPKEVYKRKQELLPHTISNLNANYKSLFSTLSVRFNNSTYKAIENVKIENTVDQIMSEFSQVA